MEDSKKMKELIQKLVMQATNEIAPVIRESEIDYDQDFAEFAHFLSSDKNNRIFTAWKEKFAELIVGECSEFVKGRAEKAMSQEILAVGDELVKHFGVEE